MNKVLLSAAALALGALLVWVLWFWEPQPAAPSAGSGAHQPLAMAQPPRGGDFVLDAWQGPVDTRDLRGSVVLIYFGYTSCPDICPTNLAFIANALKELDAADLDRVRILFVGVDPQRDTLERLKEYTGYFHPNVLGVTGTPAALAAVAGLYGAAYRRVEQGDSALGYVVDHSAFTYVVGPDGKLARTLDHATPPGQIAVAIRAALHPAGPAGG